MKIEIDQLNTILNATFKFAKQKAKEFYFRNWAKNPPVCPAFDGEVVNITREGWEHTIKEIRRTKMDVLGRLFILERAKKLLAEAALYQDHTEKIINQQLHEYWVFYAILDEISIKVIVRSIAKGSKHFLSVIRKGTIVEKEIEREIGYDIQNKQK